MKNCISYRISELPYVSIVDERTVTSAYKHLDRTTPFHVLLYVMKGQIPIIEDDTEYLLTPGTLFFLKSGVHHWGEKFIKPGTSFIFVHFFLPDTEASCLPAREFSPKLTLEHHRIRPADYEQTVITLPKITDNLIGSETEYRLQELAAYYNSDDVFRNLHLNTRFADILAGCYKLRFKKPTTTADLRVEEVMTYLRQHRKEAFHSENIEEALGLSYKYLEENFKKKTGMTIQQYHTDLRMHEAARLLRSTLFSVSEISEQVGYQDPLYFSNVFKKSMGYSPRSYRNNIGTMLTD